MRIASVFWLSFIVIRTLKGSTLSVHRFMCKFTSSALLFEVDNPLCSGRVICKYIVCKTYMKGSSMISTYSNVQK